MIGRVHMKFWLIMEFSLSQHDQFLVLLLYNEDIFININIYDEIKPFFKVTYSCSQYIYFVVKGKWRAT